ncbi:MAG: ABC transporter substrate-binding protein [Desulfobacteraceae bacterium]|nr:ABC transporter substrate-binding protein [Desulfobacteraceae bacterium]
MVKMYRSLIFLLFLAVVLTGQVTDTNGSSESVVIGVPIPLSGNMKEFGMIMKNSFEMAQEDINTAGGIKGHRLDIRFADNKGDVSFVKDAFDKAAVPGSVMLVGGYSSDATYRMARMAEKRDIPFLICTASADRITQRGWKNIYRLNPPISEYTKGLEDFWVKNLKLKSMAILYEDSMFGTDGALRMIEFCREQAIEVRANIGYDKASLRPAYLRSRLAPLTDDPPDVIYMISYLEDAVMLVKHIRELKIASLLCGAGGGFTLEEFARKAGNYADYLLTASLWSEHVHYPGAGAFYREYAEHYGKSPDYHGAEAYSALIVASEALKQAKSFNPGDIRDALDKTYIKTPFAPVKFYSYEGFERQNSINTLVLQIINGKYETIWPPDMASATYRFPDK